MSLRMRILLSILTTQFSLGGCASLTGEQRTGTSSSTVRVAAVHFAPQEGDVLANRTELFGLLVLQP